MAKTEERPTIMNGNYFEVTGKVNYIDVKYSDKSGTAYTRVLMGKKASKDSNEYDTFAFTFFGETAEDFAEKIKKGDTVNITGVISVDKYEKNGKTIEQLKLIGKHFVKAEYSEEYKGYIMAKGNSVPWA